MRGDAVPRSLIIWRDSVAAGDDGDAPHEVSVPTAPDATISEVVHRLARARYLASIIGGIATWIIQTDRPIAVVAQQWTAPRYLVSPDASIWSVVDHGARPHVHARYWCQVDPDLVFECLRTGQPLPEKHS
jgi:hypothetical protein